MNSEQMMDSSYITSQITTIMETESPENDLNEMNSMVKSGLQLHNIIQKIIRSVVKIVVILLTIILLYSVLEFIFLVFKALFVFNEAFDLSAEPYNRERLFITHVQGFISAVLLLTILVEFLHSLTQYLRAGTTDYIEIITEIALIAIVRHLLVLDIEHVNSGVLIGLSALIFVIGLFYLIIARKLRFLGINIKQ
jgi:uncharacterized membrane protein (DUF373 family)